jgi:hypothetical protein
MADPDLDASKPMALRARAAGRLRCSDVASESVARATRSLAVLHALASSPATAADALAVLHELQVHQAGTRMLGVDPTEACGLGLATFVAADSLAAMRRLSTVVGVDAQACGNLRWPGTQGAEQWVCAEAGHDPSGHPF